MELVNCSILSWKFFKKYIYEVSTKKEKIDNEMWKSNVYGNLYESTHAEDIDLN